MQVRLAGIAQAVAGLQTQERGASAIVDGLQSACRGMRTAVNEVQSVELELRIISVNAIVSARQMGAQGGTLKVIAGAIRELGSESASRSADARAALESIGETVGSLAAGYNADTNAAPGATLLADFNTRVGDLQSASSSGAASAATISALAGTLRGDIQNTRDRFNIGGVFAETIRRRCDLLGVAAAHARQSESSGPAFVKETAEHRYTMEAERRVHRSLTSGLADVPSDREQEVEFF
jgi:hypothetical protein